MWVWGCSSHSDNKSTDVVDASKTFLTFPGCYLVHLFGKFLKGPVEAQGPRTRIPSDVAFTLGICKLENPVVSKFTDIFIFRNLFLGHVHDVLVVSLIVIS